MVGEPSSYSLLVWIPLLPLAAAVLHGVLLAVFRRPLSRTATILLSCGAVVASFVLAFIALIQVTSLPEAHRVLTQDLYTWIGAGDFSAEAGFLLDPLSAVMILMVTGVGSLIHIYSIGYMDDDHREDRGYQRFFCYLNLFMFSMLILVLADNLVLMFLGWEGVGLCSYLLIGFWYSERWNAYCGMKAFVVNRIGDFAFLVGIFLLFTSLAQAGHAAISFRDIHAAFGSIAQQTVTLPAFLGWLPGAPVWRLPTLIGVCFFIGAMGKSAQLPLYVWLPDAMAGPTPVSALIHAATMVTAGVYMVCRLSFLYSAAPGASALIAWTGAITAMFAATIAIAQTDIKKVLAYSTVSQLGYMFLAAGCGAYSAAIFHVITHAFFKGLLFLGAGSVILAMHHEQDTDHMGGLRRMIPVTHWTFLAAVLAISGAPYFSGFFSKDEILLSAYQATAVPGHLVLYAIGVVTAGLTALYMFRLYFRTFWGECRAPREILAHIREPGWAVLFPLVCLGVLSALGGFLGPSPAFVPVENANSLGRFLAPLLGAPPEGGASLEWRLAGLSLLFVFSGFGLALWLYVLQPGLPGRIRSSLGALATLVQEKFLVDELYDRIFVRPLVAISEAFLYRAIDSAVIDQTGVTGPARAVRAVTADVLKYLQSGLAQAYFFLMIVGALAIAGWLVR